MLLLYVQVNLSFGLALLTLAFITGRTLLKIYISCLPDIFELARERNG